MKLESLESLKFKSFENDRIDSLREIVGGMYYIKKSTSGVSPSGRTWKDTDVQTAAGYPGDYDAHPKDDFHFHGNASVRPNPVVVTNIPSKFTGQNSYVINGGSDLINENLDALP